MHVAQKKKSNFATNLDFFLHFLNFMHQFDIKQKALVSFYEAQPVLDHFRENLRSRKAFAYRNSAHCLFFLFSFLLWQLSILKSES